MLGFQARSLQRGLDRTGQPAFLRGVDAGKVNLAKNVALYAGQLGTADDNMMARYTVATISNVYAPKTGDFLEFIDAEGVVIPGETYVLDALVADNGATSRYVLAAA